MLVREHLDTCADCQALLDLVSSDARYAQTKLKTAGAVFAHSGGAVAATTPLPRGTGPTSIGVQVGDIIDGKYLVERILGEGGMGLVLQATHLQLRQPVALKFMHFEAMQNSEAAARFNREARAAVRLTGQHICRVLDMGEADTGEPYIVFEYLDGKDLGELLNDRGAVPMREAVGYMLQACDAMAEAHAAGIVHRDLKPGNLFVTPGRDGAPCLKVLDFGISKYVGAETDAVKTTTRSLMGSPLYMAPEQLLSAKEVDARADIWAIGAVLYQLLSGRTPFCGETLPTVIAQVMHATAPPLAEATEGLPDRLCRVVDRCLSRDRDDRYANVADLAAALAEFAPDAAFLADRSAAVLGGARPSQAVAAQSARGRNKLIAMAVVAAGLAAVVIALVAILRGGGDDENTRTAPSGADWVQTVKKVEPAEQVEPAEIVERVVDAEPTPNPTAAADTDEVEIEMAVDEIKKSRRSKRRVKDDRPKAGNTEPEVKKPPPLMDPTEDPKPKTKKQKNQNKPVARDGIMDPG